MLTAAAPPQQVGGAASAAPVLATAPGALALTGRAVEVDVDGEAFVGVGRAARSRPCSTASPARRSTASRTSRPSRRRRRRHRPRAGRPRPRPRARRRVAAGDRGRRAAPRRPPPEQVLVVVAAAGGAEASLRGTARDPPGRLAAARRRGARGRPGRPGSSRSTPAGPDARGPAGDRASAARASGARPADRVLAPVGVVVAALVLAGCAEPPVLTTPPGHRGHRRPGRRAWAVGAGARRGRGPPPRCPCRR